MAVWARFQTKDGNTSFGTVANGQITDQSGSGVAIVGYIVATPNQEVPFLGIEFSAA